jgi:hypothetical protein
MRCGLNYRRGTLFRLLKEQLKNQTWFKPNAIIQLRLSCDEPIPGMNTVAALAIGHATLRAQYPFLQASVLIPR